MKILILGSCAKGAMENYYIAGFKAQGHEVDIIDIQQPIHQKRLGSVWHKVWSRLDTASFVKAFNRQLVADVAVRRGLDVIIVFKGMEILPETLDRIRPHTKLLVNYNPDHPFLFFSKGSGNTLVREGIRHYDMHFSYSQMICQQLSSQFGVEAHWLPFGYMPEVASPAQIPADIAQRAIFIGAWDTERADFFNALPPNTVTIIGPDTWQAKTQSTDPARQSWAGYALYDGEATAAHAQALASINLFRPQNRLTQSHNMRTFEVPSAGGVLISPFTEEQATFFEPNTEALYYQDAADIPHLIQDLKAHPNKVAAIKAAAKKRAVSSGYDYFSRSQQWLSLLESYL